MDQDGILPQTSEANKPVLHQGLLQSYLVDLSRYELLPKKEERQLAIRVKENRDQDAASRLITSNLRLVVKIAMEFQRYWTRNLLELIQEGNVGLVQAVEKFDPYRNVKFSYYASFWIRAYILKFIMENWSLVKIGTSQSQRKLFFNLKKARNKLIAEGVNPEPKLLAEKLDVKEKEIVEMSQRMDSFDRSLDQPLSEDSGSTFGDFLQSPAEDAEKQVSKLRQKELLRDKLKEFRDGLSERESSIFDDRLLTENPVPLREIGDRYRISRERVRQIQQKMLHNIHVWLKEEIPNFEDEYSNTVL
jgi:RNA polymerase sigma-32 factor